MMLLKKCYLKTVSEVMPASYTAHIPEIIQKQTVDNVLKAAVAAN